MNIISDKKHSKALFVQLNYITWKKNLKTDIRFYPFMDLEKNLWNRIILEFCLKNDN